MVMGHGAYNMPQPRFCSMGRFCQSWMTIYSVQWRRNMAHLWWLLCLLWAWSAYWLTMVTYMDKSQRNAEPEMSHDILTFCGTIVLQNARILWKVPSSGHVINRRGMAPDKNKMAAWTSFLPSPLRPWRAENTQVHPLMFSCFVSLGPATWNKTIYQSLSSDTFILL